MVKGNINGYMGKEHYTVCEGTQMRDLETDR